MSNSTGRVTAGVYCAVSLAVAYINLGSTIALGTLSWADAPLLAVLALHVVWGVVLVLSSTEYRRLSQGALRRLYFMPELLGGLSLLLFLFSFIYAVNANMDYVQRFVQSGGALRIAIDTRTERLLAWARIFPLVAVDLAVYFFLRFGRFRAALVASNGGYFRRDVVIRPWALVWVLTSVLLSTIAQPSFVNLDGIGLLGWVALVPLFLVLRSVRFGHGFFYLVLYGVLSTLLSSYWLGTFSLVSLQIVVLIFLVYYLVFAPLTLGLYRFMRPVRVLVFPLAFTLFEYLRSIGFLGYPWALTGHSQYALVPLIQLASVTGVWGISFIVLLANSALAEFIGSVVDRQQIRRERRGVRRAFRALAVSAAVVATVLLAGTIALAVQSGGDRPYRTVRVAQVQQNNDPRLSTYEETFATLRELTAQTVAENPDLIIWSETAFVPNLRRWADDQSSRRLHTLVNRFLSYQEELGHWLLTGNDDYQIVRDDAGSELERLNFNAAVLFDDSGRRTQTYQKMKLVPFTEHFPYRDLFPWAYELLLQYEVTFWAKGDERTVFEHPLVRFSTPICYEDVFPNYVRGFVLEGAELLANISNDYWSLTEVQAKQHFVAGLFRSVENRRPVIRTTSSGLTGHIDAYGRVLATAPYFEETTLVSEVQLLEDQPLTLYTRWGDFFPLVVAGTLLVLLLFSIHPGPRGGEDELTERKRRSRRAYHPVSRPGGVPEQPVEDATREKAPTGDTAPTGERRKARRRRGKVDWRAIWDQEQ